LSDNRSDWIEGSVIFSGFEIPESETFTTLKIKTHPALMPGQYSFTFSLKGTAEEEEEEYITPPVVLVGPGYIPLEIPETDTGEVTATPEEGGITNLINPDGSGIKLIVPPGAVSKNTVFNIKKVDINSISQSSPESGLFLVNGLVYEIEAQRNGELINSFGQPLTLTFIYTEEQTKGFNKASLKIYYWEKNQDRWIVVETSKIDLKNNTVTASIKHFTLFALIGSEIEATEDEERILEETAFLEREKEELKEVPEKEISEEEKRRQVVKEERGKAKPEKGRTFSFLASIGQFFSGLSLKNIVWIVLVIAIALLSSLLFVRRRKRKLSNRF